MAEKTYYVHFVNPLVHEKWNKLLHKFKIKLFHIEME